MRRAGLELVLVAAVLFAAGACASSGSSRQTAPAPTASVPPPPPPVIPVTVPEVAAARPVQTSPADTAKAGRYDNGKMWTFDNPPVEYLKETYNFAPDQKWFEEARLGALRFATYCSASFVSPNGLVMTNHHCARESVVQVTGRGENLYDNGFYAPSLQEERKVKDLFVDQLVGIRDVTREVYAAVEGKQTEAERAAARTAAINALVERLTNEAGGKNAGYVVQVVSLYNGGKYSAYTFRRYDDVRLVMAPELQIASFGGDPDNFTYPRYDLDMSFFRVYRDGKPMPTEHYFRWSKSGAKTGDLTFVIGNPGSTNRLETVAQLEWRRDVQEKSLLALLNERLAALRAYYEKHPSDEILTRILSISNSQKAYTGRVAGLNDAYLMARRADAERQFQAAIDANPTLKQQYGDLIARMADIQRQKRELGASFTAFLSMAPGSSLEAVTVQRALLAHRFLSQKAANAPADQLNGLRDQMLKIEDRPAELERQFLLLRLQNLQSALGPNSEVVRSAFGGQSPEALADAILGGSVLDDSAATAKALQGGTLTMDDPALRFVGALMPELTRYQSAFAGLMAQQAELASQLGRAHFDVSGVAIPPDATFSLRIADGVVKGYPYNGTLAPPFTTMYGIYDRHYSHRKQDWDLPTRWKNPPETLDLSTPMNLASTNDIIGGNSGSAMVNQNLEVVGLVFDGNIESLPGAFIFVTDQNRTVSVDSRAILESLDEIYDADRIAKELTTGRVYETEKQADAAR